MTADTSEVLERFSVAAAAALPGPDWLRCRREGAAAALQGIGFPTAAEEVWRYSPVGEIRSALEQPKGVFPLPEASAERSGKSPPDCRSAAVESVLRRFGKSSGLGVIRNGEVVSVWVDPVAAEDGLEIVPLADAALSTTATDPGLGSVLAEAADDLPDAFGLLNDVFATAPLLVRVRAFARLEHPVLVVNLVDAASSGGVFPRLLVSVGEAAEAQVVDVVCSDSSLLSGTGGSGPLSDDMPSVSSATAHSTAHSAVQSSPQSALVLPVAEMSVGAGARLGYLSIQELDRRATAIANTAAVVGKQGYLNVGLVAVGGSYARLRTDCSLAGRGATGDISAMYFADGSQIHDFRTFQNHVAADTTSNLLFVGAVDDDARSIYSGLIRVGEQARGTDAEQTNRVLKLADGVWAESVPNLEIENNDVRCAHATSVGPIDEAQRFYLESRGVPPEAAERLIVDGYFGEVARRLPVAGLAESMRGLVSAKLHDRHEVPADDLMSADDLTSADGEVPAVDLTSAGDLTSAEGE